MKPIAWVHFTDGPRPVYEDESGQFTYDDLGEKIDGIWYLPPGEAEFADVPLRVDSGEVESLMDEPIFPDAQVSGTSIPIDNTQKLERISPPSRCLY